MVSVFMRIFLMIAFFIPIFSYGMHVSILDRFNTMPQWEINELVSLVQNYEGKVYNPDPACVRDPRLHAQVHVFGSTVRLAEDFINICCKSNYASLDPNIVDSRSSKGPLIDMIKNPVGRELVYRIMAKIVPRKRCVDSLRGFLSTLASTGGERKVKYDSWFCA